ncbi:MAG: TerB family tellurite resistance protein [Gammaproteobacteria bacterium]
MTRTSEDHSMVRWRGRRRDVDMHIILAIIVSIVTIVVLLKKLADAGIDLGGLNPFLRRGRTNWRRRDEIKPIYALDNPMELAGLLLLGVARRDGDLSGTQKGALLGLFREEFHLSDQEAASLLGASVRLLNEGDALVYNLEKVLAPGNESMSKEQIESTVAMMEQIAGIDGTPTESQRALITDVREMLLAKFRPRESWD